MKVKVTVIGLTIVCILCSAFAIERSMLDARIAKLMRKFEQMQQKPTKRIPIETLRRAQGILLLDRTKAGFIFAFQGGSGVAMVRDPQSGQWGPTAFVAANEASLGVQVGIQQSFIVVLFMTTNATRMLTEPNFEFGGEARGTAGEVSAGTEAAISTREAAMLIYDDRKGLYGGAALKGAALSPDTEANLQYYGDALTMRDILFDGKVKPNKTAIELARIITEERPMTIAAGRRNLPSKPAVSLTASERNNVAVEQLQALIADLNANKQTNALRYLNSYLAASITTQYTADASLAIALLEQLRAKYSTEAVELVEMRLDGALIGLSSSLSAMPKPERPAIALQTLQRAKEYRTRFPRKVADPTIEEELTRGWKLLPEPATTARGKLH
jgi:lipid-binding SYLF domain-containing protein